MNSNQTIVKKLAAMFEHHSDEWYMGESVTIVQHMLQAAHFATTANAEDELIIAALLHDIGHYTSEFPEQCLQQGEDNYHQDAGADFLADYFPPSVTEPIRLHVACKRYLCAVQPSYLKVLSEASIQSLAVQGGPMNPQEVEQFEQNHNYKQAIRLRHFDEAGKDPKLQVPGFETYIPMMERLLTDNNSTKAGSLAVERKTQSPSV